VSTPTLSPRRRRGKNQDDYKLVRKRVSSLKPSPENTQIYRPADPRIGNLAESIKRNGCDPLTITRDDFIVSGHRRHAALLRNGQVWVRCRVLPHARNHWTLDEYLKLLRDHNEQRDKTPAEQMRESLIDIDPEQAYQRLRQQRDKSINAAEHNGVVSLNIEGRKVRYKISKDKAEHVRLIKLIVEDRRQYWPLSSRGVHYPLLNYEFVRGYYWPRRGEPDYGTKRVLKYANDEGSYNATCDLIMRLRLNGQLPWEAFDDPTRPFKEFRAFGDARQFVKQEVNNMFAGYWRNLLQSQPNYITVLVEKNTIYHMALQITEKYQIPTLSARGFNSIDSWHDLSERFQDSGKEGLIVIVLSDFDPEGEQIPQSGGRTLRDDFGIENFKIIKAGVKREQIQKYNLPRQNFAKESSSNHDWFVERNNGDDSVFECEALEPKVMLADLDNVIRGVIDIDLFNAEVARERDEAAYLESARRAAREALKGIAD
jgi:hypothetical protein